MMCSGKPKRVGLPSSEGVTTFLTKGRGEDIDYQVRLVSFPPGSIKETVTENEGGNYTIFIEHALSHEEQRKEFLHAMSYILGNDFSQDGIQQIELQAHNEEMRTTLTT